MLISASTNAQGDYQLWGIILAPAHDSWLLPTLDGFQEPERPCPHWGFRIYSKTNFDLNSLSTLHSKPVLPRPVLEVVLVSSIRTCRIKLVMQCG